MKWLVKDRIQLGRGILATGVGGVSKTRLQYHFAIGSTIGRLPWDWEIETTGKSVLVLTEDTAGDVHRTFHHTCQGMELSTAEIKHVSESVALYALAGLDVKLLASGEGREVIKTPNFESLVERINAMGDVVFVGLDPALSLKTGDEMDQGHQRALGKMIDDLANQTGAVACLVAHATKGSLGTDEISSHNSRGGGAITDAVRGEFAMRTMTAKEAKLAGIEDIEERKRHVQLVATKGNHLPPAAYVPVWLRRGDFGTLAAADIELRERSDDVSSGAPSWALNVLRELCANHVPTLAEWRSECVNRKIIGGPTDNAIQQAMKRIVYALKDAGEIEHGFKRGVWVPTSFRSENESGADESTGTCLV